MSPPDPAGHFLSTQLDKCCSVSPNFHCQNFIVHLFPTSVLEAGAFLLLQSDKFSPAIWHVDSPHTVYLSLWCHHMREPDLTLGRCFFPPVDHLSSVPWGFFRSWWPFHVCQGFLQTGELTFFCRCPWKQVLLTFSPHLLLTYSPCLALGMSSLGRFTGGMHNKFLTKELYRNTKSEDPLILRSGNFTDLGNQGVSDLLSILPTSFLKILLYLFPLLSLKCSYR